MKKGILVVLLVTSFICFVSHGHFYLSYDEVIDIAETLEETTISVKVYGAVEEVDVYEVPKGSFQGYITEHASLRRDADIARLDEMLIIDDPMAIYIPRIDEECLYINQDNRFYPIEEVRGFNEEQLIKISGVGASIAKKLYDFFQTNEVTSFEQLKEVDGIGEKKFEIMMKGR